jgi:hypothetical protein
MAESQSDSSYARGFGCFARAPSFVVGGLLDTRTSVPVAAPLNSTDSGFANVALLHAGIVS